MDITDAPVELKTNTDPAALEIIMTRRGAIISGRVTDEAGKGTETGYVMLIFANPARRRTGTGIVNTAKPKADGTLTLAPVRAGEYVILAVSGVQMMHLTMPVADEETLERAVPSARGSCSLKARGAQSTFGY